MRCASDVQSAKTVNAMAVVGRKRREWIQVTEWVMVASSISRSARWVLSHCACLAQPGHLVCFHRVDTVASIVPRLRALDADSSPQSLLGEFLAHTRSLGTNSARCTLLLSLTAPSVTRATTSSSAIASTLHLHG